MSKAIGNAGLKLIKEFEGCRLTAYKCAAGVWTIGYGHTVGVYPGMTITQAQAEQYLIEDCQKYADYVDNKAYVPLTGLLNNNQRDALISFAFNCGANNLKKLCAGRNLNEIATAMLLYNKAKGKTLAGLTRRRKAEQALFYKQISVSGVSVSTNAESKEEYNMPTIKRGSKGKAVEIWQVIIGAEVDGDFGPNTEKLTKVFQNDHGLLVDGIVGKNSWRAGLESV